MISHVFFHVALLFLFSDIGMETRGGGTALIPGKQCFRPIYLYELLFRIIFSAFLNKNC